jgi:hypothetical protein
MEGRPFKASELTLPTLTNASERCQEPTFQSVTETLVQSTQSCCSVV